jgi:hypothetical protein
MEQGGDLAILHSAPFRCLKRPGITVLYAPATAQYLVFTLAVIQSLPAGG